MAELPALGKRGEGWVLGQFALIALVVVTGLVGPRWPSSVGGVALAAGSIVALCGAALAVWAARALGRNLTPLPRPRREGVVVQHGPYALVRHPVYTGGLAFLTGFSLAFSPLALAPTAVLAVFWGLKVRVEERFLRSASTAYAAYAERTRYRLVPHVY